MAHVALEELNRVLGADTVPFSTGEAAWFWALPAYLAKRQGARVVAGLGEVPRPCEPADVVNVVLRLVRRRRLAAGHLRVLVEHGSIGTPPDGFRAAGRQAVRLWAEAFDAAEKPFRLKGIVA